MANIWSDIPCVGKPDYPTQKPLELLERVILSSSNPGDVVLDPFMGSGTTCLAAAMHDRKFIGIDLTPIAVAQAKGRLEEAGMDLWMILTSGAALRTSSPPRCSTRPTSAALTAGRSCVVQQCLLTSVIV